MLPAYTIRKIVAPKCSSTSSQCFVKQNRSYYKNDPLVDGLFAEYSENLERLLKENRFTEADKAFKLVSKDLDTKSKATALDYFRGLHSVTQAFTQTHGVNTGENIRIISTLTDLINQATTQCDPSIKPIKVAVTGATGNIGYAILFRIASGQLLGPNVPIDLHLLDVPASQQALKGVVMELQDGAFPLLRNIRSFSEPDRAFEDIDYALLIGSRPRSKGMERSDLLMANAEIFSIQGKALDKFAKRTVKTVVVGNPANTNCLIASRNAPSIPAQNFTSMMRLDHNRAAAQIAIKTNVLLSSIENLAIWGNHSATQYPNINHVLVDGKPALSLIQDQEWVKNYFIPTVQQRGAAIISARGLSSAASAASAAIDQMRDWVQGTQGNWTSMGVNSNGEYGVTAGLNFSYPVVCAGGRYDIVKELQIDTYSAECLEKTHQELLKERDAVSKLLP